MESPHIQLDPLEVLALVRPLILVIDRTGNISAAHGASDGLAGYRTVDLPGRHILDFVSETDREDLTRMLLPRTDNSVPHDPTPFPVQLVGANGELEPADLQPSGFTEHGGGWVVTITPRRQCPASMDIVNLMIDGASLETVLGALITHQANTIEEANVDPHIVLWPYGKDPTVISTHSSRSANALRTLVAAQNDRLWRDVESAQSVEYRTEQLPALLRFTAEADGFDSCTVTRIDVDGHAECVLVTLVSDASPAARSGDFAINQREQIRFVTHAVRRDAADRALRAAALEDALTGLSNRGRFDQLVEAFDGANATLLFIDLDHFKAVNDQFGHRIGDAVLIEVAERMRRACRPTDVIARIGGDEFAVLLTDTDEMTARSISERLLKSITDPLPEHLGPASISASVGYARRNAPADIRDLLHAADRAMLSGKRSGRSCVIVGD
jgi:diguanylate cyclase (GGDEF)-like protein